MLSERWAVRLAVAPVLGVTVSVPVQAQNAGEGSTALDPVVVTGTRTETPVSEIARSVTVVDREQIEEQTELDHNLGEVLARTVPGLGPSTETPSNFSQTLRGRNFLVLVDGIPQSTPLRDGGRDLNTIAASSIERIEVVRGGTAVYGFGATGGVVNVITKEASPGTMDGYSRLGGSISTEHVDSSGDVETEHRVSGTRGAWDYVLSGSYLNRGGRFDADGNRIPPDPMGSQGGYADTEEYSILGKTGFNFDQGRQRLEFMVNHLNNEQDTDFTVGTSPDKKRTEAVPFSEADPAAVPATEPGTTNTIGRVSYLHGDLAGSALRADVYYGDQQVIYPKYPFAGFPQSGIESEKFGGRGTVETPLDALTEGATLTWGLDYLADETRARFFGTDQESGAPDMDQTAVAGFAEMEVPLSDIGIVRGGVRHEDISVDTSTVESNGSGNTVRGGTLEYDETLLNAGVVFFLSDAVDLFASYSQGFSIADVGRVIRDAGPNNTGPDDDPETFRAEDFESEAEKVDNYEIGMRYYGHAVQSSLAFFYSKSDNGTTFDNDLNIQKFQEDVWGVEGTVDYAVTERLDVGGSLTWMEGGRQDQDQVRRPLDGTRIPPLKLTSYVGHQATEWWRNRLQLLYVGGRDEFGDSAAFGEGEVKPYALVDLISTMNLGPGKLNLSVRNLLNRDYFPHYSQAANFDLVRSKGRGRTVGASYSIRW